MSNRQTYSQLLEFPVRPHPGLDRAAAFESCNLRLHSAGEQYNLSECVLDADSDSERWARLHIA